MNVSNRDITLFGRDVKPVERYAHGLAPMGDEWVAVGGRFGASRSWISKASTRSQRRVTRAMISAKS